MSKSEKAEAGAKGGKDDKAKGKGEDKKPDEKKVEEVPKLTRRQQCLKGLSPISTFSQTT